MTDATLRYSRGAILLHWIIAGALAVQIATGFGMPSDISGFAIVQFHKSLGITILLLTVLRIVWRLTHKAPPAAETGALGLLAKAVHFGLYLLMIAGPLTGWALVSTDALKVPTLLFGMVPWPHMPLDAAINHTVEEAHELIAFVGIGLFGLHVAGALKHHFVNRDTVLARMAPGGAAGAALVLMLGVLAAGGVTFALMPGHEDEEEASIDSPASLPSPTISAEPEEATVAQEPLAEEEEAEVAEPVGPPPQWTIQPGGSLRFSASNGGSALNGSFSRWSGDIAMNPDDPAGSNIAIRIELASATLGDATQDQMLAGADFFAASANPTATFRSTDVEKTGANSYRARGTLSLKGASRPQTIAFTLGGSGDRRSVSGSATVDRNAFGVGTGETAAGIAPQVRVDFAFDAVSGG